MIKEKSALAGRQANTSVCPRCGASFVCGMQSGQEPCWCAALPSVMPLDRNATSTGTCYCSECLKELIDKRVAK